tara:strand:- start:4159 stop:6027 length:1869 start_codon:yes stop_codon:yes gene_type:complete
MQVDNKDNFSFDLPKNKSNVIKVIGVGGGGSNAINYMFHQGIKGVDFVVSNTDAQALSESPVPIKIQLGATLTEGLGAGANPEVGASAAKESFDDLQTLLTTQTKMVFITAGMGGGTGTGAAPIIAQMAKELDILTVGIVTMPFQFEGKLRTDQAQIGLANMKSSVDSLIVINNNKLREVYGNLGFKAGFSKADEVLATAARGIAEVITHHYTQNIDLKDAKTVLTNSGTAIMGSGNASGANRAQDAIVKALDSPLLNDNKISGCRNVLLLIVSGTEEITIDEIGDINDFIQEEAGNNANIIMGVGEDQNLGSSIAVTIIATGFNADQQHDIFNTEAKKIIHNLEDDQKMEHQLLDSIEIEEIEPTFVPVSDEVPSSIHEFEADSKATDKEEDFVEMDLDVARNLEVIYELIELPEVEEIAPDPIKNIVPDDSYPEEDFVFNDLDEEIRDIEVIGPELVLAEENQFSLEFDLSLDAAGTSAASNQMEVLSTEEEPLIKYELDEDVEEEIKENEHVFQHEEKELSDELSEESHESSPFEQSISASTQQENEKRKEQLKKFNYAFKNSVHRIEELERQPAYKRQGIDLSNEAPSNEGSRMSLDTDSNDQIQLRSNNSFLHDNVD